MAGHSKWANIKFRKAAQDKKRGKLFTKLIREITTSAKMGGGDPDANPRLRAAIDKALAGNMTRDTIDRAVKRGVGGDDDTIMEEIRYEGYGPAGVAVMVDCLTDNRNRTVAEVRHAFSKSGGNLGTDGSVSYLFTKQGILTFSPESDEEKIMDAALEAGADDVITHADGAIDVISTVEDFTAVKAALNTQNLQPEYVEITMNATTMITLDKDTGIKLLRLVDALEELDDVQRVYFNADVPDDALAEFE